jgi:RHS repeat-associated protein
MNIDIIRKITNFLLMPAMLVLVFPVQNLFASQEYKSFLNSNNSGSNIAVTENEYTLDNQGKGYRDFDEDTTAGLYYLHARYYDSTTRQFLSKDPAGMKNLYGYCVKDPINNEDPTGYLSVWKWITGFCEKAKPWWKLITTGVGEEEPRIYDNLKRETPRIKTDKKLTYQDQKKIFEPKVQAWAEGESKVIKGEEKEGQIKMFILSPAEEEATWRQTLSWHAAIERNAVKTYKVDFCCLNCGFQDVTLKDIVNGPEPGAILKGIYCLSCMRLNSYRIWDGMWVDGRCYQDIKNL